jgi:UDP-N-acetylmuramate-alanine ligase
MRRFNVMDYAPVPVIADYGHKPDHACIAVAARDAMPAQRRSVISA